MHRYSEGYYPPGCAFERRSQLITINRHHFCGMDGLAQRALTRSDRDLRGRGTEVIMPLAAVVRSAWKDHGSDYAITLAVLAVLAGGAILFFVF